MPWRCQVCAAEVDAPVFCGCGAMLYCGQTHARLHGELMGHAGAECARCGGTHAPPRLRSDSLGALRVQALLTSSRRMAQQCTRATVLADSGLAYAELVSAPREPCPGALCFVLEVLGVHGEQPYTCLCACSAGTGAQLHPSLAHIRVLRAQPASLPCTWPAYCEARGLPLHSPAPLVLHPVLTFAFGLRQLVAAGEHLHSLAGPWSLHVAVLGADTELRCLEAWEELLWLLPGLTGLQLTFVGPVVPNELDGMSARFGALRVGSWQLFGVCCRGPALTRPRQQMQEQRNARLSAHQEILLALRLTSQSSRLALCAAAFTTRSAADPART